MGRHIRHVEAEWRLSRSSQCSQSGIRANSSTCRAVVEVCAKARDLNKALAVLLDFLQAGERLECSVFNAVSLLTSVHSILLPTSFPTYLLYLLNSGQVMKLCGEMGNMECATRVFELMLQALIAPNSFTYSAFIEACVNGKNSTRALQALFSLFPLPSPASSHMLPSSLCLTLFKCHSFCPFFASFHLPIHLHLLSASLRPIR